MSLAGRELGRLENFEFGEAQGRRPVDHWVAAVAMPVCSDVTQGGEEAFAVDHVMSFRVRQAAVTAREVPGWAVRGAVFLEDVGRPLDGTLRPQS